MCLVGGLFVLVWVPRGAVEMLGAVSCFARAGTCCTPAGRWGSQLQVKYPGLHSTRWSCGLLVKRSSSWASCVYSWINPLASPQPQLPQTSTTSLLHLWATSPLPPVHSSCSIKRFNHFPVYGVRFWVQIHYYLIWRDLWEYSSSQIPSL